MGLQVLEQANPGSTVSVAVGAYMDGCSGGGSGGVRSRLGGRSLLSQLPLCFSRTLEVPF